MIEIRPFQPKDWALLLDFANQAEPFAPRANAVWWHNRQAFDETRRIRRHCIATEAGLPVGYGAVEQQGDDPAVLRVFVVCSPQRLNGEVGERLYAAAMQAARAVGAARLWAQEFVQDQPICEFFARQGFAETRRFTPPDGQPIVVMELDIG